MVNIYNIGCDERQNIILIEYCWTNWDTGNEIKIFAAT